MMISWHSSRSGNQFYVTTTSLSGYIVAFFRVSGGVDTEWEWALEGRRVVPLMPRLLHPTPLTSLATAVSKAINLNPKICASQPPAEGYLLLKSHYSTGFS